MDSSWMKGLTAGAICACLGALAGCASPQARDFTGAWHPVNRYALTAERIPLHPAYVFEASPLDATLRGMLTRWAADARLRLDYRLAYDLTLHEPVANLRSPDPTAAVERLDALFAGQGVGIAVVGDRIVVATRADTVTAQPVDGPASEAAAGGDAAPGDGGR